MSRLIFTAIGKLTDPDRPEGLKYNPYEDEDYTFKVSIILSEVVIYGQYNPNPAHPYYKYKGDLTKVGVKPDYERMLLCSFEEFDQKYQQAMQGLINHKHN